MTTSPPNLLLRMDDLTPYMVVLGVAADVLPGPNCDTAEREHPMVAAEDDQDLFHKMEEQVCHRITEHFKGILPV